MQVCKQQQTITCVFHVFCYNTSVPVETPLGTQVNSTAMQQSTS